MVPLKEWSTPTLTVSAGAEVAARRENATPVRSFRRERFIGFREVKC